MSDRVNLKVDERTREALREHKRDGETWDGCLNRLASGSHSIQVVVDSPTETETFDLGAEDIDIVSDGPIGVRINRGVEEDA